MTLLELLNELVLCVRGHERYKYTSDVEIYEKEIGRIIKEIIEKYGKPEDMLR